MNSNSVVFNVKKLARARRVLFAFSYFSGANTDEKIVIPLKQRTSELKSHGVHNFSFVYNGDLKKNNDKQQKQQKWLKQTLFCL